MNAHVLDVERSMRRRLRSVGVGLSLTVVGGMACTGMDQANQELDSSEARSLLEQLRGRFIVVDAVSRAPGLGRGVTAPGTNRRPLLPARGPTGAGTSTTAIAANVQIPPRASDGVQLADRKASVSVQARLLGAADSPAETADGYAIFRDALGHGSHLLSRVTDTGYEDFITFEHVPPQEKVEYELVLGEGAAGLRLIGDALEIIDAAGTPRLHVSSPWLLGEDGARTDAHLDVSDCGVDRDPSPPWGRAPIDPGAARCTMSITWSNAHYPAVLDPEWSTTASMITPRYDFAMLALPSGKILAAGGGAPARSTTALAEIYDSETGTWAATGSMSIGREAMSATFLENGTLLAAGGWKWDRPGTYDSTVHRSAEIYDPKSGTWSLTTSMAFIRESHTATRLLDGRVLVTGGAWPEQDNTAEVYDPHAATWTRTANMAVRRWAASGNRLADGRVLVAGGWTGPGNEATATAELFDPSSGTFSPTGPLSAPREEHQAIALPGGKVFIFGGQSAIYTTEEPSTVYPETELYDPATGTFGAAGAMPNGREFSGSALTLSNYVVHAGGGNLEVLHSDALIYDVKNATWQNVGAMSVQRNYPGVAALADGSVLVCGGFHPTALCDRLTGIVNGTTCGDALRASSTEECDLGEWNGTRSTCSAQCRAQDMPLVVDASGARARSRMLGLGAHPLAGWPSGALATAFVETNDGVPSVKVAGVAVTGVPTDRSITVGAAPNAIAGSDPVIAPIADGASVVAFTDSRADGDLLGVALRRVYPFAGTAGPLVRANSTTRFSQFDPDIVFTGSEIVVAWSDDSELSTGPDIRYRVFDPALNPVSAVDQLLAGTAHPESNVVLSRFATSWAAAWRSISAGAETIHVKAGSTEWTVGPFASGPDGQRPALTELDSTHLLVAFTEGTGAGTRLRLAILDVASPGLVAAQDAVPADSKARDQLAIANSGSSAWIAWREQLTEVSFQLFAKELAWDRVSKTLDLTKAAVRLPRDTASSDRRRPALAPSARQTVAAAWDDISRVFGTPKQKGDVMIETILLPISRLP